MKRILFSALCCLICVFASADVVTKEKALEIAGVFGGEGQLTKSMASGASIAYEVYPPDAPSPYHQPACYVINYDGGGFAVIAANDVARPILAYSKAGKFDPQNMSSAQKEWFEGIANAIYHSSEIRFNVSANTKAEWAALNSGNGPQRGNDVVLETAAWTQREPFNNKIPFVLGKACPTGCVSTAGAILMRYYKHPEAGNGTIPGYNWYDATFPDRTLGDKYDWDAMPLKYEQGSYSDHQAEQVAQLMYDIGTSIKTEYLGSSSGASMYKLRSALISYFGYDPNMIYMERWMLKQSNADKVWESVIRKEIDEHRLVLMDGSTSDYKSSHAFVVCGYSGDYFCFNWGWGESEWYGLLTPVEGYDDQMSKYPIGQNILYNIHPNEGGTGGEPVIFAGGIRFSTWHYQKSVPFKFCIDISNASLDISCEIEATYALIDKDRNIKEIIKNEIITMNIYPGGWGSSSNNYLCTVTKDFCETDEFALCYRLKGDADWIVADAAPGATLKMKPQANIQDAISVYIDNSSATYAEMPMKIFHFSMPMNVAIRFDRQSDGAVLGDTVSVERSSYGNTHYWYDSFTKPAQKEFQNCTKSFRAMPGETWDVTFYDIKDSYTISLKF